MEVTTNIVNPKYKQKNLEKGFTLVELLVVISILSLMSSIVLVGVASARKKARDSVRNQNLKQLVTAIEFYRIENGQSPPITTIPSNPNQLNYTDSSNWNPEVSTALAPYLVKMPPSLGNINYTYAYAYNNAYMLFIVDPSMTHKYCLSLSRGSSYTLAILEDPRNIPSDAIFSDVPNTHYYLRISGSYRLDPTTGFFCNYVAP